MADFCEAAGITGMQYTFQKKHMRNSVSQKMYSLYWKLLVGYFGASSYLTFHYEKCANFALFHKKLVTCDLKLHLTAEIRQVKDHPLIRSYQRTVLNIVKFEALLWIEVLNYSTWSNESRIWSLSLIVLFQGHIEDPYWF